MKHGGVTRHGDGRIAPDGAAGSSRVNVPLDEAARHVHGTSLHDAVPLSRPVHGAGDDAARNRGVRAAVNGPGQAAAHHVPVHAAAVDVDVRAPADGFIVSGENAAHDLVGKRA